MDTRTKAPETIAVHNINFQDEVADGVNLPIYPSSVFGYRKTGTNVYPRYFNTINQQALVAKLARLEHTATGIIFGSGMAAISTALFGVLQSGDHAIFHHQLYGGTFNLINYQFKRMGIDTTLVTSNDPEKWVAAITDKTKVVYFETPSNPLLNVIDIEKVAAFAKAHSLTTMIDNTFASPINQNPAILGIDIVLHSGTKYLGGHSDLCFGALLTSQILMDTIYKSAVNYGGSINALDAYLIDRSLKTLAVRVKQQNENALKIARFLEIHPKVARVNYPGLATHSDHVVAKKQMSGFGGMLSFEFKDARPSAADNFLDKLQLSKAALSLGGVESTVCVPAVTSHAKLSAQARQALGVSDALIRLSVGIECVEDIIVDLNNAMP